MTQSPNRLRTLAGEEEYLTGEMLHKRGGVRVMEQTGSLLKYVVAGTPRREVTFTPDEPAKCSCETWEEKGACRHVVAATLMAQETGALEEMLRQKAASAAPRLMAAMESALPEDGTLRMEVTLFYENGGPRQKPRLRRFSRHGGAGTWLLRLVRRRSSQHPPLLAAPGPGAYPKL